MYFCIKCKEEKQGAPKLTNGVGSFCPDCHQDMLERSKASIAERNQLLGDKCIWCGDEGIDIKRPNGDTDRVCDKCQKGRSWLLSCIRHGERVAKYVAKTEQREAPARKLREKQALPFVPKGERVSFTPVSLHPATEDRLNRIEAMLNKLTNALGGI
jgi:hypothetical protein